MSRFQEKIARFMYGRYGMDALYLALVVFCMVLAGVNMFVHSWIISLLMSATLFFALYRVMSRKHAQRAKENNAWLKVWRPIQAWFKCVWMRVRDVRVRRYRRCPQCKATLRLPVKRGKHAVDCPRCKCAFTVRILF